MLLKTEWFNNGIRLGTHEPERSSVIPACVNSFQFVMRNQTKTTVFIIQKFNLTGIFTNELAVQVWPAVLRLALGAGKGVTLSLGLFAGTDGTSVSPFLLIFRGMLHRCFPPLFKLGGCASKAGMLQSNGVWLVDNL